MKSQSMLTCQCCEGVALRSCLVPAYCLISSFTRLLGRCHICPDGSTWAELHDAPNPKNGTNHSTNIALRDAGVMLSDIACCRLEWWLLSCVVLRPKNAKTLHFQRTRTATHPWHLRSASFWSGLLSKPHYVNGPGNFAN